MISNENLAAALSRSGRGPIHYISPAPWNLLGMRHWLPDLHFLCGADFCDGLLPHVACAIAPRRGEGATFEQVNERILRSEGVLRYIRDRGPGGHALFLIFDEGNERAAADAGLSLATPTAAARAGLDDKIATTRMGDRAGVRSVPNVLGRVDGYATLRRLAAELGPELVVQLPFGDSGMTTFFVGDQADYDEHAVEIEAAPEVKVMRRIRCRQSAIEACVTRHGTVVGPLATELVGFPELTPYRGGWCGNEVAADAFSAPIVEEAAAVTRRFGDELQRAGYRGVFGLDFLIDEDGGDLFLGELNPRITGLAPLSTQVARDLQCAPLVLLHLLEWLDVPYELDAAELSGRFQQLSAARAWSQLIIKETCDAEAVASAPASGIWAIDGMGQADLVRPSFDTGDIRGDGEALVLRTVNPGWERPAGLPIARLMAPGRMMTPRYELEPGARTWISAVRSRFQPHGSGL